jgi:serine/threonine-protein kinase
MNGYSITWRHMSDVLPRLATALESRYRIARQIGIGGMATVYLAHDLKHDRDVAIKVLHPDLAAALGAERFLAEIKTTAKLQHPHILPLLDSGEAGGLLYYVMPYVAGESLRSRLERETQLAVDDAVRIAREVASALDYAHRHGVVHRDIKPENILIHEDQALVADFGIALAVSAAGGPRMTQTGLSLGTPAYMAPEQAMGERAVDGRADIYALGAVTYEMLVGEAPFTGPTVQAIVARVMTESPRPVTGQRKSVPANVNAAVLRALEKLPADRFHTAAEFSTALITQSAEPARAQGSAASSGNDRTAIWSRTWVPWLIAGLASAAALAIAVKGMSRNNVEPALHLSFDLPAEMDVPPGGVQVVGLSDDGLTAAVGVVIGGRGQLVLRRLDDDSFRIISNSAGATGSAVFSPDGKWLAFGADNKIWKTPVSGGPSTQIGDARWAHMTWAGNGKIVYAKTYDSGLSRMSSEGGDTATLTVPDRKRGELGHWWPTVLPDGDHVLFTNYTTPADKSKLEVLSLKTGKRNVVLEGGYFGRYVQGHLIFVRANGLMTVPFDASALRVKGTPVPVPLDVETDEPDGWAGLAVSSNGTLIYRTDVFRNIQLTWTDDKGNEEPAIDSAGRFTSSLSSPDDRKIATVRDGDIWIFDRQRKLFSRLTRTPQRETSLVWSPDNRYVYYSRDEPQYEIFRRSADGSQPEEKVVSSPNDKEATSISPDGRTLIFQESMDGQYVFSLQLDGSQNASKALVVGGPGNQSNTQFSPDGKWIIYDSNESGRTEVFLAAYPVGRGPSRQQVSDAGGEAPSWGPDGRTIFYSWSGRIYRVRVNPETGDIGRPELLSRIQPVIGWNVASDGRFLVARVAKGAERHSIKVILNWASTLDATKQ